MPLFNLGLFELLEEAMKVEGVLFLLLIYSTCSTSSFSDSVTSLSLAGEVDTVCVFLDLPFLTISNQDINKNAATYVETYNSINTTSRFILVVKIGCR